MAHGCGIPLPDDVWARHGTRVMQEAGIASVPHHQQPQKVNSGLTAQRRCSKTTASHDVLLFFVCDLAHRVQTRSGVGPQAEAMIDSKRQQRGVLMCSLEGAACVPLTHSSRPLQTLTSAATERSVNHGDEP
uniref:Uncharacterized protein n=1 Tax=Eutreptiella gymnastica TaxID=73025 RepID=A0A7S4FHY5_9EUGL|mmetsp:Transcript_59888/g.99348  ORF Transcript_59888/g.99348 Transcript_59888/m.99348 type:complete len:132 (+) Transcript_59888:17-412(+)